MDKILIFSPKDTVRESLKLMLEDRAELILTDSLEQSYGVMKNAAVRIFLMDIADQNKVLNTIEKVRSKYPKMKIIILGQRNRDEDIQKSLKKHINGFIQQPLKSEEILEVCK